MVVIARLRVVVVIRLVGLTHGAVVGLIALLLLAVAVGGNCAVRHVLLFMHPCKFVAGLQARADVSAPFWIAMFHFITPLANGTIDALLALHHRFVNATELARHR